MPLPVKTDEKMMSGFVIPLFCSNFALKLMENL